MKSTQPSPRPVPTTPCGKGCCWNPYGVCRTKGQCDCHKKGRRHA